MKLGFRLDIKIFDDRKAWLVSVWGDVHSSLAVQSIEMIIGSSKQIFLFSSKTFERLFFF